MCAPTRVSNHCRPSGAQTHTQPPSMQERYWALTHYHVHIHVGVWLQEPHFASAFCTTRTQLDPAGADVTCSSVEEWHGCMEIINAGIHVHFGLRRCMNWKGMIRCFKVLENSTWHWWPWGMDRVQINCRSPNRIEKAINILVNVLNDTRI